MLLLSRAIGIIGVPIATLTGQVAMLVTSAILAQRAFPIAWDYRLPAATTTVTLIGGATAMALHYRDPSIDAWWVYAGAMAVIFAINLLFGVSRNDWRRIAEVAHPFLPSRDA